MMAQAGSGVQTVAVAKVVGTVVRLLTTRSFDAAGTALTVDWRAVSGATGVAVDAASLALGPLDARSPGRSLSTLLGAMEGTEAILTVSGGPLAIRSLYLDGFEVLDAPAGEWRAVHDPGDLPAGYRVAVSVPQGNGFSAPVHAVPGVEVNPGVIPTLLAGASLEDRVLRLPDVETTRLRLQVLSGEFPGELRPETFRVDGISARAAPEPADLEAVDAGGQSLWQQAGRLGALAVIDLTAAVKRTLQQSLDAGDGPHTTVTVRAGKPGEAATSLVTASGRVLREVGGKLGATCEGDASVVEIPGPPLDVRQPARATADVVVRHQGLRLHPLSDPVPDRTGDLHGAVLSGDGPVVRVLPPEALCGESLGRVGLVAVVREPADLAVRLLEVRGGVPVGPLGGAHATVTVEPVDGFAAARPRVVWLDLSAPLVVDRAIAIEATASSGRVQWVANADGAPGLRFAVTLEDPTGTLVRLGSLEIPLKGARTELLGQELPTAAFAGAWPRVSTDQFCDIVISKLTLEYLP